MRVALPVWNGRISPVFDVARSVMVMDVKDDTVTPVEQLDVEDGDRVERLRQLEVGLLICGAISRPLEAAFWLTGIEVISEVCGSVDEVIAAYSNGSLSDEKYLTPGHSHRGHGFAGLSDWQRRNPPKTGQHRKGGAHSS